MTVAMLPMYDLPELRSATDALWAAIATRLRRDGIDAPDGLTRTPHLEESWTDPRLLLGQTCGYPLVTALRGRVALLATPRYTAPGCDGTLYRSAIVVREHACATSLTDLRGGVCAVNDATSNSGMNVLRAEVARLSPHMPRFFRNVVTTGSHAASVLAVAEGRADVAAIDCVTWAHLQRLRPSHTRGLRQLAWTAATPGLPLITSVLTSTAERDALLQALQDVADDPALAGIRAELLLCGFEVVGSDYYDTILDLQTGAQLAGYAELL